MTENLCTSSIIGLFNGSWALEFCCLLFVLPYKRKAFTIDSEKNDSSNALKLDLLYNDLICSQNVMIMAGPLGKLLTFAWVLI